MSNRLNDPNNLILESLGKILKSIQGKIKFSDVLPDQDRESLAVSNSEQVEALARNLIQNETDSILIQKEITSSLTNESFSGINADELSIKKLFKLENLKGIIFENKYDLKLIDEAATLFADLTFYTSCFYLSPKRKDELEREINNFELCKISSDLIFSDPYYKVGHADVNPVFLSYLENIFWKKNNIRLEASRFKYRFLNSRECLILISSGIPLNSDEPDNQKAFWGPASFSLGHFFGSLIIHYILMDKNVASQKITENRICLQATMIAIFEQFERNFKRNWEKDAREIMANTKGFREDYLKLFFSSMVGYMALTIISQTNRVITKPMRIDQQDVESQIILLELAEDLLMKRQYLNNIRAVTKFISNYLILQ